MSDSRPTVLVVDDEPNVARAYALWLEDDYDVEVATSGEEAFEAIDEATEVVLLDRRMPGMSGDEVLEGIRADGRDCRVAMVTAVDPSFDVTDMAFDAYMTKPVEEATLTETVEHLVDLDVETAPKRWVQDAEERPLDAEGLPWDSSKRGV